MLVAIQDAHDRAREFVHAAKAESTKRTYRIAWRDFSDWCVTSGLMPLPAAPETVALYLASKADTLKPATLGHRLAAISKAHSNAGYESPASMRHAAVSEVLTGIRRTKGVAQDRKAPLLAAQLIRALAKMRADLVGLRDHALLLVGFSGAFRRSELVTLDVCAENPLEPFLHGDQQGSYTIGLADVTRRHEHLCTGSLHAGGGFLELVQAAAHGDYAIADGVQRQTGSAPDAAAPRPSPARSYFGMPSASILSRC